MSTRPVQRLSGRAGRSHGFTLIELMVVIAILAVLTTLIVSVSSYVRTKAMQDETQANMKIIMSAIMAYQDAKLAFPSEAPGSPHPHRDGGAQTESANLYVQLNAVPQSRQILQSLPPKAIDSFTNTTTGVTTIWFVDSFRKASMDYYYPLAGRPALVSAGKDGKFGPNDTDSLAVDNLSSND